MQAAAGAQPQRPGGLCPAACRGAVAGRLASRCPSLSRHAPRHLPPGTCVPGATTDAQGPGPRLTPAGAAAASDACIGAPPAAAPEAEAHSGLWCSGEVSRPAPAGCLNNSACVDARLCRGVAPTQTHQDEPRPLPNTRPHPDACACRAACPSSAWQELGGGRLVLDACPSLMATLEESLLSMLDSTPDAPGMPSAAVASGGTSHVHSAGSLAGEQSQQAEGASGWRILKPNACPPCSGPGGKSRD